MVQPRQLNYGGYDYYGCHAGHGDYTLGYGRYGAHDCYAHYTLGYGCYGYYSGYASHDHYDPYGH